MADITEKQVYEAFGLGEQVQEPADPATKESTQQGAQEQEVADPAQAGSPSGNDAATANQEQQPVLPAESEEEEAGKDGQPLTPEQRRKNADVRRQREKQAQQAAIDRAVQSALQTERDQQGAQMTAIFASLNLKNNFTGEAITNMEQFQAWQKQIKQDQLQKDLRAGKLTPEGLTDAIGNHPVVQQAQQMLQQNEEAQKAQRAVEAKAKIDAEIAEIGKLDASITSLEDLMEAPYWPQLYAMTQKGYSIKDAHFLLNHKRLEEAKLEAARQQGMLNARGKDHMRGTATPQGGGAVSVPPAEMAMYRAFNPGATDAEIQAYYNNLKKK